MPRRLIIAIALPVALLGAAGGGVSPRYVVTGGSSFRIDGTSTVGRYSCSAARVDGRADVPPNGAEQATAEVTVGVGSFDCGNSRMNRDFRDALRQQEHPSIRFTLDDARVIGTEPRPGAWVPVRARGRLSLAGVERRIDIRAQGRRAGHGAVTLRGEHPMRMTDFQVDPPTGLLGAVRAHDAVVVRFELHAVEVGR
jgi:polyisoprenoid-binding protein YceI